MHEASREVAEFVRGVPYSRFETDRLLRYAVERQLLVIGEAARRVSTEFRTAHGEFAWEGIIGLRNILAHEYGEILVERIWHVATVRIPELLRLLTPLIPKPPEESEDNMTPPFEEPD